MSDISPYEISIPDSALERLRKKLELTDFPDAIIDEAKSGWKYGAPLKDIKRLHSYWLNNYSWRSTEDTLNVLPNFITSIKIPNFSALNIHFLHQKSGNPNAIPLLFVHGWPGRVLEVTKMLPLLKGGEGKPAFDVVAPSLPNYCFSDGVKEEGFALEHYAEVCNELMKKLGYNEYVTQGGDWGYMITRGLAYLYPENVKACHINWIFASPPPRTEGEPEPEYSEREKRQLAKGDEWATGDGSGYLAIQSTKPATIAYSFKDSPVGLLAWIYDKLVDWSDDYPWTDDEILTWVSLYYFSKAGPDASSYHYYESRHGKRINTSTVHSYIDIPLGLADFPVEIANAPKAWRKTLGPIVFEKQYEKGGHYAGWERPGDIADGLAEMFGKGGGAFGVVEGKKGY